MEKRKVRIFYTVLIMIVFSLSNIAISYASEVFSSYKTFPTTYGYTYKARASVNTDGSSAWSYTDMATTNGNNAPAGYMGAKARVFDQNGGVKKASDMTYTSQSNYMVSVGTGRYDIQGGTFYGKGLVDLYNGNGYTQYETYQSPSQNNSSSSIVALIESLPDYKFNKNGQTYGSSMLASTKGYEPDLISAIGEDGTEGYVYAIDLNGTIPKTPEEAIKLTAQRADSRMISLYKNDGKTIIGTFKIETVTRETLPEK
jgi:hypothetical protein